MFDPVFLGFCDAREAGLAAPGASLSDAIDAGFGGVALVWTFGFSAEIGIVVVVAG